MFAIGKVNYVQKKNEEGKVKHFFVLDTGLPCIFATQKPLRLKNRTVRVEGIPRRDRKGRIILEVRKLSFTGRVYVRGKVIKRFPSKRGNRELLLIEEQGRKIPVEVWNAPPEDFITVEGYIKDDVAGGHILKAINTSGS